MDTCLWIVLLWNNVSQLTNSMDLLILSTFGLLLSQTMLRLSLKYVIWWLHLGFRDECVQLSTTKFDWSVKNKSMQEVEVGRRWVGSVMSWWKSCEDVRASRRAPSTVVLSFFHQKADVALMSPGIIGKRELDDAVVFKMSSKFDKNSSNLAVFWHVDL